MTDKKTPAHVYWVGFYHPAHGYTLDAERPWPAWVNGSCCVNGALTYVAASPANLPVEAWLDVLAHYPGATERWRCEQGGDNEHPAGWAPGTGPFPQAKRRHVSRPL